MPGLFGIVSSNPRSGVGNGPKQMHAAMDRGERRVSETVADPGGRWGVGRVHLGVLQPKPQLVHGAALQVLFHGELVNRDGVVSQLAGNSGNIDETDASVVSALYRTTGPGFGARLKGTFCAAVLDEAARRVVLVSDRMGSYPIYWFSSPDVLAFASELRALLRVHPRPALNPAAVSDLIALTFPFGEKTLAADTHLLPPASTLTWQWDTGTFRIEARTPPGPRLPAGPASTARSITSSWVRPSIGPWTGPPADRISTDSLCLADSTRA